MSSSDVPQAKPSPIDKAAAAAREAAKRRAPIPLAAPPAEPAKGLAPAPDAPPILECTGIHQRYPAAQGKFQLVLNDINLSVPSHDFISVVGPSGCGKSTLLRLVLGSEFPWKGQVRVSGRLVDHPARDRGIVFQKYSLFPHLTVLENVVFGLELDGTWLLQKWLTWPWYRKTKHKQYADEAMYYLRTVKLDEHADKYPHQLSGGMQQRVAIAQAMIMKPSILLMDEPFGALDPGTREALQVAVVEMFKRQDITIFFVTHDLEEAVFVANRVLVLSPFHTPSDGSAPEGARIVMDARTPKSTSTSVKVTAEFQDLVREVRAQGFDKPMA